MPCLRVPSLLYKKTLKNRLRKMAGQRPLLKNHNILPAMSKNTQALFL
jgi:hypothetical protein